MPLLALQCGIAESAILMVSFAAAEGGCVDFSGEITNRTAGRGTRAKCMDLLHFARYESTGQGRGRCHGLQVFAVA